MWRLLFRTLLILLLGTLALSAQTRYLQEEGNYVEAELLAEMTAIAPGQPFWVALRMKMDDHWHTYWANPGDAGLASEIAWDLPEGFTAGPIQWPYPERIAEEPLMTFAYEGEIYLLTEITPGPQISAGETIAVQGTAEWLVCETICLPGAAEVRVEIQVAETPQINTAQIAAFDAARMHIPQEAPDWAMALVPTADGFQLQFAQTEGRSAPADAFFFDYPLSLNGQDEIILAPSADQPYTRKNGTGQLALKKSDFAPEDVPRLHGVLFSEAGWDEAGKFKALHVDVPVSTTPLAPVRQGGTTLWLALGLAFLGGLILNLMPCVFPVLSIKILGFVQQADANPQETRKHGYWFAFGVIASFWVLAGLLLLLRAGGEELGWGFQLQSPLFVALMALLLFALGLNLMGVFEFGTSLTRLGGLKTGSGTMESFSTGVLATIVATPCTAPFMGAALGFAVTQPPVQSLIVFTALGLGMAAPYVVLSALPALTRRLPKPGPWMETFKHIMAFPLFATVIWLIWVFGLQVGIDNVAWLLIGLLCAGMALWLIGRWPAVQISRTRWGITRGLATLIFLAGLIQVIVVTQSPAPAMAGGAEEINGVTWEPFSAERVTTLRAEGTPVFIDFTAAWCLSCQVNKRVALTRPSVSKKFQEHGVVTLKADWTNRDPEITRALAAFGRSGVPLYVLYDRDPNREPVLLPEILEPGIVISALDQLAEPSLLSSNQTP